MSGFAEIHNLAEVAAWTSGGNHAKPILRWSTTDGDVGDTIAYHQVRIYTASSGGSAAFDTTKLPGNPGFVNCNYPMPNLTARWWTIETWDSFGESSGESSRTEFKVNWGQAKYEYAVPSGASTSGWSFSAPSTPANTQSAFLFGSKSSAGDPTAWKATMSEVTPDAYVKVLVRLSTYASGTQATLSDMTFSYSGSASQPEFYVFDPTGDWSLDPGAFRYGTKSLKFAVTDNVNDRVLYPFRTLAGDDIIVAENTTYVYSCYVRTDGPLGSGSDVRLQIYAGGGLTNLLAEGTLAGNPPDPAPGRTSDTSAYLEQWQRIHLHITTGSGQTVVRPVVRYHNGGAGNGDAGWLDAIQFEEGVVVSPWHPNQISLAGLLDGYGLTLDALAGAVVNARASDGVTANLDDIVHAAAGGGGGGGGLDFVTVGAGTLISEIVTVT